MERKTTLHIQIDEVTKRQFKVLCTLDGYSLQQQVEMLVKQYIHQNEWKIKNLDK
jgi:antitoxin component of RelBE/YafQ-DinJ toxin-antitoxin module